MSLAAQLHLHRNLYRSDLHIHRLVSRQPPTTLDVNTGELYQEPGAATGMPMSGRLLKYLGHPEGFGSDFPWSKALWLLRVECRRKHPQHRSADRPFWRGALCHQAVLLTVVRGFSPENAGKILRLDHTDALLKGAFRFMEDAIDEARLVAEARAREDEGRFTIYDQLPEHHIPSEAHIQECPNPICRAKRKAA